MTLVTTARNQTLEAAAYLPYRIVTQGEVSLVTTCGPDLVPATWATDGTSLHRYAGALPLIAQPPVIALAGLPTDVSMASGGVTLLGMDGSAAWHHERADILWPVAGDPEHFAYCVIPGADPDPIAPYGVGPVIVGVRCPQGRAAWRSTLPGPEPVLDIALYALGSKYGLLCVQHGFEDYNLWSLDLSSGDVKSFHIWRGVPFNQAVYPGPIVQPAGVALDGEQVVMHAYVEAQGWRRWTLDILDWKLISDVAADPPDGMIEESPHPASGAGAPRVDRPLFPQSLLPEQFGQSWTIPALQNARGAVLVVTTEGASWVTL